MTTGITISVDVGEHHAALPPSNSGYSPMGMFCEYRGTRSPGPRGEQV